MYGFTKARPFVYAINDHDCSPTPLESMKVTRPRKTHSYLVTLLHIAPGSGPCLCPRGPGECSADLGAEVTLEGFVRYQLGEAGEAESSSQ